MTLPWSSNWSTGGILGQIGDTDESRRIAVRYFETMHTPLAFISKIRFYDTLFGSSDIRSDLAFLLLCMKLVMSKPISNRVRPETTDIYRLAKQTIPEGELSTLVTIPILQAMVLIALYEIGHGIYPSAYVSIGTCARYGLALGLDRELNVFDNSPRRWIELEERRRAWWAVLILDRYDSARPN